MSFARGKIDELEDEAALQNHDIKILVETIARQIIQNDNFADKHAK